jgi:hypothetical protein
VKRSRRRTSSDEMSGSHSGNESLWSKESIPPVKIEANFESSDRDAKTHVESTLTEKDEEMKQEQVGTGETDPNQDDDMDNKSSSSYYSSDGAREEEESPLKYPPMFKERMVVKSASNDHH